MQLGLQMPISSAAWFPFQMVTEFSAAAALGGLFIAARCVCDITKRCAYAGAISNRQIWHLPDRCLPSKHKTFVYHLYNVGPTSSTLVQHCINVIQMFCVCWLWDLSPWMGSYSTELHSTKSDNIMKSRADAGVAAPPPAWICRHKPGLGTDRLSGLDAIQNIALLMMGQSWAPYMVINRPACSESSSPRR